MLYRKKANVFTISTTSLAQKVTTAVATCTTLSGCCYVEITTQSLGSEGIWGQPGSNWATKPRQRSTRDPKSPRLTVFKLVFVLVSLIKKLCQ